MLVLQLASQLKASPAPMVEDWPERQRPKDFHCWEKHLTRSGLQKGPAGWLQTLAQDGRPQMPSWNMAI